jgi:hypothetical protein
MQRARLKPTITKIRKKQQPHTYAPRKTAALTLAQHILHLQRTVGNRAVRRLFAPGAAAGKHLIAPELTHTIKIKQAAVLPCIALSPEKDQSAGGGSKLPGEVLDVDRNGRQILVAREVGSPRGYDDRLQAAAVARLAKADPAAAAKDKAGKWHAFETKAGIIAEEASANDPRAAKRPGMFSDVDVLPSFGEIALAQQDLADLKAKLLRLDALEVEWRKEGKHPDVVKGIHDERTRTQQRIIKVNQRRAAVIFGVTESEVQLNLHVSDRVAGLINLTTDPGPGANSSARHGPVAGQSNMDFHPGLVAAFDLNASLLDTPERAQGALFHEVSHLKDFELAQLWVGRYEQETKRVFVGKGGGLKPFLEWVNEQVRKKRLSAADGELVVDEAADASATTEARSNIRTFLTFFQTGLFDEATRALTDYATALPPGTIYASPPSNAPVLAELTSELQAARRQAAKPAQANFDAALAAAKKVNATTWFAQIDFLK